MPANGILAVELGKAHVEAGDVPSGRPSEARQDSWKYAAFQPCGQEPPNSFGTYAGLPTQPRVMQFALRYEF